MKSKQILGAAVLMLVGGLGVYALLQFHRSASRDSETEEEVSPTVVSVQVGALKRVTLHRYVTGFGMIMPAPATASEPAADATLAAPAPGVVATVNVVEGQSVARGDLVLTLNSSTATADYAQAELERQQKLYGQHNTSLKSLQDAEAQVALLRVVAPLSGTVTRVTVKAGSAVDPTTVVAEVMDLHRLVASIAVPAPEAAALSPGQGVQVLGPRPAEATLTFISPTADPADGTVRVRAALPADTGLRPGEFLPLRIVTDVEADCLAAPEASVVTDIDGHDVVAVVHGDEAVATPVATGLREGGWVQITAPGLKAGDTVVTVGAYGLPDKTRIEVVGPLDGRSTGETAPATPGR